MATKKTNGHDPATQAIVEVVARLTKLEAAVFPRPPPTAREVPPKRRAG